MKTVDAKGDMNDRLKTATIRLAAKLSY